MALSSLNGRNQTTLIVGISPGTRVYRGVSSISLSIIANVMETSYVDLNVTGGQIYYYKVSAVNIFGEGNRSKEMFTILATVPSAPTNTSATPSDGRITLSWTAPSNNGGSNITGYAVYRGTSSDSLLIISNVTRTDYVDTNVITGQKYYYKIRATNSAGVGPLTSVIEVSPLAGSDNTIILLVVAVALVAIGVAVIFAVPGSWNKIMARARKNNQKDTIPTITSGSSDEVAIKSGLVEFNSQELTKAEGEGGVIVSPIPLGKSTQHIPIPTTIPDLSEGASISPCQPTPITVIYR